MAIVYLFDVLSTHGLDMYNVDGRLYAAGEFRVPITILTPSPEARTSFPTSCNYLWNISL